MIWNDAVEGRPIEDPATWKLTALKPRPSSGTVNWPFVIFPFESEARYSKEGIGHDIGKQSKVSPSAPRSSLFTRNPRNASGGAKLRCTRSTPRDLSA